MDLKMIRDHLNSARSALGAEHPLSSRIEKVERALTPGGASWRDDAVSAENDLLAISTELEALPKVMSERHDAPAEVPPGVNEAIKQIADALELL
jgi:hypothetical protein